LAEQCFDELLFRVGAQDLGAVAGDNLGHAADAVLAREIVEFGRLYRDGCDVIACERQPVCEANGPRTMGSSRGDEHLDRERLGDAGQPRLGLGREPLG
jgi:hypothetical protein